MQNTNTRWIVDGQNLAPQSLPFAPSFNSHSKYKIQIQIGLPMPGQNLAQSSPFAPSFNSHSHNILVQHTTCEH